MADTELKLTITHDNDSENNEVTITPTSIKAGKAIRNAINANKGWSAKLVSTKELD